MSERITPLALLGIGGQVALWLWGKEIKKCLCVCTGWNLLFLIPLGQLGRWANPRVPQGDPELPGMKGKETLATVAMFQKLSHQDGFRRELQEGQMMRIYQ